MRIVMALVLVSACTDDVTFGDVQVIDTGGSMVEVKACLDEELLSCGGDDVVLVARHMDAEATVEYTGLLFAQHHGAIALLDRSQPFVISNGASEASLRLPAPFELVHDATGPLGPRDSVTLTWQGVGDPMLWRVRGECVHEDGGPRYLSVFGGELDDDGHVTLTVERLAEMLEDPLAGCEVEIELSRVREGSVDDGFRATSATALARRSVFLGVGF